MDSPISRVGADCDIKLKQENYEMEDVDAFMDDGEELIIKEEQILSNIKIEETQLMPKCMDYYKYEIANTLEPSTIGEQTHELTTVVTEPDEELDKKIFEENVLELVSDEDKQNSKAGTTAAPFAFSCETCELEFSKMKELRQHQKMHDGKNRYQCKMCNKGYHQRSLLLLHLPRHAKNPQYKCAYCGRLYFFKNSMLRHVRKRHKGDKFQTKNPQHKCAYCGRVYFHKSTMLRHVRKQHKDKLQTESCSQIDIPPEANTFHNIEIKCSMCEEIFNDQHNLDNHIMIAHVSFKPAKKIAKNLPHMCPYCELSYCAKSSLRRHIKTKHGKHCEPKTFSRMPKTNKWYSLEFICGVCGKIFNAECTRDLHMKIHASNNEAENCTSKEPLHCTYCGKIFKTRRPFRDHLRTHTKERPFKCNICNKTFRTSTRINEHLREQHKNYRYHCVVCNESFVRKRNLLKHVITHSDHQFKTDDNEAELSKDEQTENREEQFGKVDDNDAEEEFINIAQKG